MPIAVKTPMFLKGDADSSGGGDGGGHENTVVAALQQLQPLPVMCCAAVASDVCAGVVCGGLHSHSHTPHTHLPSPPLPASFQVIKAFPDYPKIKKEVLEKARMGLKP